ncbi:MAG: hypothetical protein AAGK78_16230, partial [Planctomycetota bacterium]
GRKFNGGPRGAIRGLDGCGACWGITIEPVKASIDGLQLLEIGTAMNALQFFGGRGPGVE